MYEIERYVRVNTIATASFLERLVAIPRPKRLVVASSMSIYGEGEYGCPEHGARRAGSASRGAAAHASGSVYARVPGRAAAASRRGEKPLIPTSVYAITKRDHEELCQVVGLAYGVPTVALRFFNVYGPGQALSNPYTGVAAIFSSRLLNGRRTADLRGRAPVEGFRSRQRHRPGDRARARLGGGGRPRRQRRHRSPGNRSRDGGADRIRARSGHRARAAGTSRAGDIRHCFADPTRAEELLGFKAGRA